MFNSFLSISQTPHPKARHCYASIKKDWPLAKYRPTSLTGIFSKLMERVVVTDLVTYLRENDLITKHEHEFMTLRICRWANVVSGMQNDCRIIYVKFITAFIMISHPKLLRKLETYEIQSSLLNWINHFCQIGFTVKVDQSQSSWMSVLRGVI